MRTPPGNRLKRGTHPFTVNATAHHPFCAEQNQTRLLWATKNIGQEGMLVLMMQFRTVDYAFLLRRGGARPFCSKQAEVLNIKLVCVRKAAG